MEQMSISLTSTCFCAYVMCHEFAGHVWVHTVDRKSNAFEETWLCKLLWSIMLRTRHAFLVLCSIWVCYNSFYRKEIPPLYSRESNSKYFHTKLELQLSPMSMRWNANLSREINFKKQIQLSNTWPLIWKAQGNLVKVYARVFKLSLQSRPILTNFSHAPFSVPRSSLYFPILPERTHLYP